MAETVIGSPASPSLRDPESPRPRCGSRSCRRKPPGGARAGGQGLDRWYALLGIADIFLGRLGSALHRLRKSVEINPNVAMAHFFLAAASALSDRAAEACEARKAGLKLDPNFTVARFRNERRSEKPTFLAQRERIYEGLSLAGVPEG